jgi:hypothetical protein
MTELRNRSLEKAHDLTETDHAPQGAAPIVDTSPLRTVCPEA